MSDTEEKNNEMPEAPAEQKTQWLPIISDMIILMVVMSVIGYLCNLIMKPFEKTYPTDSLVSIILKAKVENGKDDVFAKEMADGMKAHEDFINIGDLTGRTPLMWTVYANFNDPKKAEDKDKERLFYVDALLKTPGIKPNQADKDGFTALHWAAWSGMPQCCGKLVKDGGLDVNAKDNAGYTPLMLAALRGNVEVVRLLLAEGADATLANAEGKTAADLAASFESSYNQRSSFVYTLIYSKNREAFYKATLALLAGGDATPAVSPEAPSPSADQQSVNKLEVEVQEGATEPTTINPAEDTPATAE